MYICIFVYNLYSTAATVLYCNGKAGRKVVRTSLHMYIYGKPYYIHVFNYCNLFGRARRRRRRSRRRILYQRKPLYSSTPPFTPPFNRIVTTGRGGSVCTVSSSRRSGNVVLMCRYQINPKVVVVDIHLVRVPAPPLQLTTRWTVRWTKVSNKDPRAVVVEWAEVLCVCVCATTARV